ncbi:hypothetical protein COX18_10410 [Candidatus Desantisbacteria bacterium CG23_combo_of_CG06-09_8_20_14_all_40_23]|uniref:Uncharacterized protein n=1 Tax=Candidatus Desantisbacteria bacterium CG23_combo_of_CG06-09_8_20_14_all_40_23 TaxID=1974550 RepID=A0A2H0A1P6_9BACT|nr:MAG: hypothetical protein COX18_10410 [Candidatus Desantisbacteria bacterium CG23_combo_of_CG06-09_8_20_14_all_40_23]
MALPIVFLMYASRIIPIVVRVGTALSRFIIKNPKILGSAISVQAISAAIQSHESSEKEKIEIVNEIGKENPQLRRDLIKNIFHPDTNILSNIAPYLIILLIIYLIIKK